ncbi:12808_t:CDS:2, partial [Racocetra fulgida]
MEKYSGSLKGIDLAKFDFPQARSDWKIEYENEQTQQASVEFRAHIQIPLKKKFLTSSPTELELEYEDREDSLNGKVYW